MLLELKVSNFAIIENVDLCFQKGLNILSGETGAGKSILLKSLGLIMGGKASSEMIRTGEENAAIEGAFDLTDRDDTKKALLELDIPVEDDLLIVKRIISHQGRSRVYLNNSLAPLSTLRELVSPLVEITDKTEPLIEMTGQHDNKNLLNRHYHIELIDQYSGVREPKVQYKELYKRRLELKSQIEKVSLDGHARSQRVDYLKYQIDQITKVNPTEGELDSLVNDLQKLKYMSRLVEFGESTVEKLYGEDKSVLEVIQGIGSECEELVEYDKTLTNVNDTIKSIESQIEEVVYELRDYSGSLEMDPSSLEEKEQRYSDLRKLMKKFGPHIEDVLKTLAEMETELEELENFENNIEGLKAELKSVEKDLKSLAFEMHKRRVNGGSLLSESVNKELLDLNMKGAIFEVQVKELSDLNPNGSSEVEFFTRSSKNDEPKPLVKVASGGELSRILLSLKRVIGSTDRPRTYLFDEVDAGVSGQTAEKVGRKLKSIARGQQVICVTHLPQVAAFADSHFLITKEPGKKTSATMSVNSLNAQSRVDEIARLISGEKITKTSLAHAKELLKEGKSL
jgi:DNA repair protein RecN (Recombination protein N)